RKKWPVGITLPSAWTARSCHVCRTSYMRWNGPFRPQHEQRALNLFFEVCLIVRKVDRACRAIIFTNGMDSVGPAKNAQIFLNNGGDDPVGQRSVSLFPPSHSKVHFRKYSALFWTMVSGNGDG